MKKLFIVLLAFITIVPSMNFTTNISAAEKIKLNSTNFPDKNFRNLVKEKFDKNQDGYLSVTEIKNAKTLSGVDRGIKSVDGIKYLRYLYKLNLRDNPISELDLKYNTNMKELDIIGTKLKKVTNLKYLKKLKKIKASQLWVYNQNFKNLKAKEVEIHVDSKEAYYYYSNNNFANSNFDYFRYFGSQFNRNLDDTEIIVKSSNVYEGKSYIIINNIAEQVLYFKEKELLNPSYLTLTQKTINSVKLEWKKKDDKIEYDSSIHAYPEYYEIFRSTNGKKETYKKVGLTKKTTFTHTGLTPYKEYWYKVRGYRKQANGKKMYSTFSTYSSISTKIGLLCFKHKSQSCTHCDWFSGNPTQYIKEFKQNDENGYTYVKHPDADGYEIIGIKMINTCGEKNCDNYSHYKEKTIVLSKSTSNKITYPASQWTENNLIAVRLRAYRIVGGKKYYSLLW